MKYTEEIFNILSKGGFISANSVSPLVGSNSKTLNKEKLSYPLKKRDISFQRIHFFYYICISLLKIEDL